MDESKLSENILLELQNGKRTLTVARLSQTFDVTREEVEQAVQGLIASGQAMGSDRSGEMCVWCRQDNTQRNPRDMSPRERRALFEQRRRLLPTLLAGGEPRSLSEIGQLIEQREDCYYGTLATSQRYLYALLATATDAGEIRHLPGGWAALVVA